MPSSSPTFQLHFLLSYLFSGLPILKTHKANKYNLSVLSLGLSVCLSVCLGVVCFYKWISGHRLKLLNISWWQLADRYRRWFDITMIDIPTPLAGWLVGRLVAMKVSFLSEFWGFVMNGGDGLHGSVIMQAWRRDSPMYISKLRIRKYLKLKVYNK